MDCALPGIIGPTMGTPGPMKLFSDHPESNLRRAVLLVEEAIASRGLPLDAARLTPEGAPGGRYVVPIGMTDAVLGLEPSKDPLEEGVLRVVSRVVRLPSTAREPLYRRLLEANAEGLGGVAFGVVDEHVVITAERTLQDLDARNVHAILDTLSRTADRFAGELERGFGATRPSEPPPG